MFRKNIKLASISISAGLIYSLGVLLGFVATVETVTNIKYGSELASFVMCAILMDVFFSYLFFGLVAKDYYKKPKRTTVYELLAESSKKYLHLFLNILIPLLLIFFCTITLGLDFLLSFTSLMVATIVVSVLSGVMFPVAFYLICLKRLG
jgi:hypothetical protein